MTTASGPGTATRPGAVRPPVLTALAGAPAAAAGLIAVAILLWWAQDDGGQAMRAWAPGALALVGLLVVVGVTLPGAWSTAPRPVRAAVALLGAYAAWSLLSITWADDRGAAWEGGNRTLLYVVVFALFALWPQRPTSVAVLAGAWTLGLGVLALVTLLRVGADPRTMVVDGRLIEPMGYPNAAAAAWSMAIWPAVALAAWPRTPWPLRGAFTASAVLLAGVALLSQSRGALLATPVVLVLFLALVPGRLRHLAVLAVVAAGLGVALPAILDVGDTLADPVVDRMVRLLVVGAVAAGALVALVGALGRRRPPAPGTVARLRRMGTLAAVVGAAVLVVGGLLAVGDPVERVDRAWSSFKGGYAENDPDGSRLVGGLGSNRYDFYRVALDVFADRPLAGAGADNYFQDYLERGRSDETPRYPHSLPLRTLQQTGLVGALLLLGAFAAALTAVWRVLRSDGGALAGGAAAAFVFWCVHGAGDWLWEFAGLGAAAFAMLGLACAQAPRGRAVGRALPRAAVMVAPAAVAVSLAAPWLAERDVRAAGEEFATRPQQAFARLDRAARLNPLSDRPLLVEGSVALRRGDLRRADDAFAQALDRNPRGMYATLERGAIASAQGRRPAALRLLVRAARLAPRDPLAREALAVVRAGGTIDLVELNRRILAQARRLAP